MRPKIAVFGTPEIAARLFEQIESAAEMVAVITTPDRPAGRGKKMQKSAVKIFGEAREIPVFCPEKLDTDFVETLKNLGADIFVVVAFGRLFSAEFLKSCPQIWNVHFSLLPKFRGASPVASAILAGEEVSGITIFHIAKGMDSGDILAQKNINISEMRADEVFDHMIDAASESMIEIFEHPENFPPQKQDDSQATFCGKIEKSDGLLDPKKDTAERALRKIRAFFPWPSAFFEDGTKILRAQNSEKKVPVGEFFSENECLLLGFSEGALEILELQMPGKKAISSMEFLRGKKSFF